MCITINWFHITVCIIPPLYGLWRNFVLSIGKGAWQQERQKSVLFDSRHHEWLMTATSVFVHLSANLCADGCLWIPMERWESRPLSR